MAGLYIHIPFCAQKCIYCDFFSGTNINRSRHYIDAVCCEMKEYKTFFDTDSLQTIYFGGGTPSVLTLEEIERILECIHSTFDTKNVSEVTLEANPDNLSYEYLLGLEMLGINRLSIGVQSFNDDDLQWMRRQHNAEQAICAVKYASRVGFNNVSVDLIFGLPHQTTKDIDGYIRVVSDLGVQHVSAYSLTIESRLLKTMVATGRVALPSDDEYALLFQAVSEGLEKNGYYQYEISNYARRGFESQHNRAYWSQTPYLGIGAGAYSFDGVQRWSNIAHTDKYINKLNADESVRTIEELSADELFNEYVFTSLRKSEGIDLQECKLRYGEKKYNVLLSSAQRFIASGHLKLLSETLSLTKQGIYISDMIMSDLMIV